MSAVFHSPSEHRAALLAAQERRLHAVAQETGAMLPLLYFHAARGQRDVLEALGGARLTPEEHLVVDALLDRPIEIRGRLGDVRDPWVLYTAAKYLLRAQRLDDAMQAAEQSLQGRQPDTTVVNLVIRYLLRAGAHEPANELIKISLQLAPRQADLQRWAACPPRTKDLPSLYLCPFPRPMPVTFYLPAYNMERYIVRSIEGVLDQCYPLEAFIIVDDGSTDETAALARQYPARVLPHEVNRGLAAARNTAFTAAATPWVASLDADAYPDVHFLKNAMMELENAEMDVAGVGGRLREVHTETPADLWRSLHLSQDPGSHRIQPPEFLFGSNTVYQRERVLEVGRYDERFRTNAEDGDIANKLRQAAYTFVYTPHATAYHLRRDTPASVIKMFWGWAYNTLEQKGLLDSPEKVLQGMQQRIREAVTLINDDLRAGQHAAAYMSLLYFFLGGSLSLADAVRRGEIKAGQARRAEGALFDALGPLTARFGARLEQRLRMDAVPLLQTAPPQALPPELQALLDDILAEMKTVFDAITPEIYAVLAGGA